MKWVQTKVDLDKTL
ncbi:hypothetical protein RDI58_000005 [Solanum bulbocastanum]|uniref:Uncharacterized protein n=1 Tax=Solanum bulbocastanum TaxID=147425 RepID=A0AAN8U9N1_SOLBU